MSPDLDQLLRMGAAAARKGNRAAARALFLALGREYPNDPRAWLGLATVAADVDERRQALERALAIDSQQPAARAALDRLNAEAAPPPGAAATQVLPETVLSRVDVETPTAPADTLAPPDDLANRDARTDDALAEPAAPRFPLLNLIAAGIILVLLAGVGLVVGQALLGGAAPPLAPTPLLQSQPSAIAGPAAVASAAAPTLGPSPAAPTAAVEQAAPTSRPPTSAVPVQPAPSAVSGDLPLGTILDVDGWSATLLRPDYALVLDGAIGGIQPGGRFVLAMLAITNNSASPRIIPPDLFVLTDDQGRRYSPTPNLSSAFLGAYGRGQYGDLALEDLIEPLSGMRTVPVLFDVPADASGLALTVTGTGGAGWPIDGTAISPAGP